jgi:hypothetical protein
MSHNINHTFEERDILQPDVNGFVEEKFLRYVLVEELRNSKLAGYLTTDADQYGIFSGAPEEYADYFVTTAKGGSNLNTFNFKNVVKYLEDGTRVDKELIGLFNIDPSTVVPSKEQLFIPRINIREAINLYATRILEDRLMQPSDIDLDGILIGGSAANALTTEGGLAITGENDEQLTIEE